MLQLLCGMRSDDFYKKIQRVLLHGIATSNILFVGFTFRILWLCNGYTVFYYSNSFGYALCNTNHTSLFSMCIL